MGVSTTRNLHGVYIREFESIGRLHDAKGESGYRRPVSYPASLIRCSQEYDAFDAADYFGDEIRDCFARVGELSCI